MYSTQNEIDWDNTEMRTELDIYAKIHKDYLAKGKPYILNIYYNSRYLNKYLKGEHMALKERYLAHKEFKEHYDRKVELVTMFLPK